MVLMLFVHMNYLLDYEKDAAWSENGLKGCKRFLDRIEKLKDKVIEGNEYSKDLESIIHKTIKKVSYDIANMKYNTAVSALMILTNAYEDKETITKADYHVLLHLLNPIAPHLTEELNEWLGNNKRLYQESWLEYDEEKTIDNQINMAVQVNGKLRDTILVNNNEDEEVVRKMALNSENVKRHIDGKTVVKIIVVPNKIVNIVVK